MGKDDKPDASKKDDSSSVEVKTSGTGIFGNASTNAAASTSIFGGAASTGTALFGAGFKFTPASTTTTAGTSVFGTSSLFGS